MSRVAVIVPVFNAAPYIEAAIGSVLDQVPARTQIIVVDDGSTDGTRQLLDRLGGAIQVVSQRNAGPAAARNTGLALAEAELVSFIDADDLWAQERLTSQLAALDSNTACAGVIGMLQHIHRTDAGWAPLEDPCYAMSLPCGTFRRALFDSVGPLDESLRCCEDVDWFFRARRAGFEITRLPQLALLHRRHAGNLTEDKELVRRSTLRVVARHRRTREAADL